MPSRKSAQNSRLKCVELTSNVSSSTLIVFTMPIAITNIGWKTYIINGAWDILVVGLIAFSWIETSGKTLEELDAVFEGEKHSDAPDLQLVYEGKVDLENEHMASPPAYNRKAYESASVNG